MSYNKSCLKQKIWRINSINYDSVETSYVTPLRPYNKFVACFVFRFRGPCRTRSGEKRAAMKILVGCTGSVATIKVADLVRRLAAAGHQVQVVATANARHFLSGVPAEVRVWTDQDEWDMWKGRGDPVLHIELRKWADLLVIAPLDANTLAKMANGFSFKSYTLRS